MITGTGRFWFPLLRQLDCEQGAFHRRFTLNSMEEPGWTNFKAKSNGPIYVFWCRYVIQDIKTWRGWGGFGWQEEKAALDFDWSLSLLSATKQFYWRTQNLGQIRKQITKDFGFLQPMSFITTSIFLRSGSLYQYFLPPFWQKWPLHMCCDMWKLLQWAIKAFKDLQRNFNDAS